MIDLAKKQPAYLRSEEEVKELLGISDFRHMTKDGIVQFVSAIPQMDPEVAAKVIDQVPEMAKIVVDIVKEYEKEFEANNAANDSSSKEAYSVIRDALAVISKQVENEDLSDEARESLNKHLMELVDKGIGLHEKNQGFSLKNSGMFVLGTTVLGLGLYALLGANGTVKFPDFGKIAQHLPKG